MKPKAIVESDEQIKARALGMGIEYVRATRGGIFGASKGCFMAQGIAVKDQDGRIVYGYPGWNSRPDGLIKGLKCPDCGAQAYRTDHPKVATCGAYAGWFFFYEQKRTDEKPEVEVKIVNGELKQVQKLKLSTDIK